MSVAIRRIAMFFSIACILCVGSAAAACAADAADTFTGLPGAEVMNAASGQTDSELADGVNGASMLPSFDGGVAIDVNPSELAPPLGASYSHGVTPLMAVAPGTSGVGSFDFGTRGSLMFALEGVSPEASATRAGNDVAVDNLQTGVDGFSTVSDSRIETFLMVSGNAALGPQEFVYRLTAGGGASIVEGAGGAVLYVMSSDHITLLTITAPFVVDSEGTRFPVAMRFDEQTSTLHLNFDPVTAGAVGDWNIDPLFQHYGGLATGQYEKVWCPGSTYLGNACSAGNTYSQMSSEWGASGSTGWSNDFNVGVSTSNGLFVGGKAATISANQYARNQYTAPSGIGVDTVNFQANMASSPAGKFSCYIDDSTGNSTVYKYTGNGNYHWTWATNGGAGGAAWIGIVVKNTSGTAQTVPSNNATLCKENGSANYLTLGLNDPTPPSAPSTPTKVGNGSGVWYKSGHVNVNYGAVSDAQSGAWKLLGTTSKNGGTLATTYTLCTADGTAKRPCPTTAFSGTTGVDLEDTNSQQGSNTLVWQTEDYGQNISSASSTTPYNYDSVPPVNPLTVADGSGGDITFTSSASHLQANWSSGSDNVSGLSKYQYCITSVSSVGADCGSSALVPWTDNGLLTTITAPVTPVDGTIYYVCVRDWDGGASGTPLNVSADAPTCSNGQQADRNAPVNPSSTGIYDLSSTFSSDNQWTKDPSALSASWDQATDAGSGVASYSGCFTLTNISGASGVCTPVPGTVISSLGLARVMAQSASPDLASGTVVFSCINATDLVGQTSAWQCSNGFTVDTTPPNAPAAVRDGLGPDQDTQQLTNEVDLNWPVSLDPVGVMAGYGWRMCTDGSCNVVVASGQAAAADRSIASNPPQPLIVGHTYVGCVRGIDAAGNVSSWQCTNGITPNGSVSPITFPVYYPLGFLSSRLAESTYSASYDEIAQTVDVSSDFKYGLGNQMDMDYIDALYPYLQWCYKAVVGTTPYNASCLVSAGDAPLTHHFSHVFTGVTSPNFNWSHEITVSKCTTIFCSSPFLISRTTNGIGAPRISITAAPPFSTPDRNASFDWQSTDGATVRCSLDKAAWTACQPNVPVNSTDLQPGGHVVVFSVRNGAGESVTHWTWNVV